MANNIVKHYKTLTGDRYWKYTLTSQKDTYTNPKDDNYRLRIDGNNIYFLNGIKQTFVECKRKEGKIK